MSTIAQIKMVWMSESTLYINLGSQLKFLEMALTLNVRFIQAFRDLIMLGHMKKKVIIRCIKFYKETIVIKSSVIKDKMILRNKKSNSILKLHIELIEFIFSFGRNQLAYWSIFSWKRIQVHSKKKHYTIL